MGWPSAPIPKGRIIVPAGTMDRFINNRTRILCCTENESGTPRVGGDLFWRPCSGGSKKTAMGTYAYDRAIFCRTGHRKTLELTSEDGASRVLVIPAYQGRVMTSSAAGDTGDSYGWINYKFIEKGELNPQFNRSGVRNDSGSVPRVVRIRSISKRGMSRFTPTGRSLQPSIPIPTTSVRRADRVSALPGNLPSGRHRTGSSGSGWSGRSSWWIGKALSRPSGRRSPGM